MKDIIIRQEKQQDHSFVFALIERSFWDEVHTDHLEQYLVERIRHSEAFVPSLSLVAERDSELVEHILLSKIGIQDQDLIHESLALASVSVSPSYRKQGIGGALIRREQQVAAQLGFTSVVLLGHADY
jgi:predicted N-acetyltransferase YhbS